MSNLVLIPFRPGEFLALSPAELAQARVRAREILGAGSAGDRVAGASTQSPERLLTAEEMADRTGIPAPWYLEAARQGRIPHHRIGKYRRFSLAEVAESSRFRERETGPLRSATKP